MEICSTLFDRYLDMVTVGYFNYNEEPPDNVTEYFEIIEKMKRCAIHFDELEMLQLSIDYYLSHPEISLEDQGGRYPFTDAEVREIVQYIRSIIWPESPPVNEEALNQVKFVKEPLFSWRQRRQQQRRAGKGE